MSRSVDERVVQMQFDNQKFERGVSETLGTLDKLKSALNFDKETKSMANLEKTASSFDMSALAANIQTIADRFSTFGIIGDQVLRRITDKFLDLENSILRTAKSLSVDQIGAGWTKYGEKTSAVQTIMAATAKDFDDTGKQMDYVSGQLSKLNWFTDETSYSFLDMVNNIGKFTSNNIPLEKSVTAMQGISTWAAISGANVGEAGRAMYNLSQAIAVGSVKLMDWKSIENANMATAGFKETVIETAVEMGTLTKAGDGVYKTMKGNEVSVKNFNAALSDAWFTSEVLLSSLDKYGGFTDKLYEVADATGLTATELLQYIDKYQEGTLKLDRVSEKTGVSVEELDAMMKELSSDTYELGRTAFKAAQEAKTFQEAIDATKDAVSTGWMNTFELIFGNYQEAKGLWTKVANGLYDIFAEGAEARNELLEEWHSQTEGGYQDFVDAIGAMFDGLYNVKSLISEIVGDILPGIELTNLTDFVSAFKSISGKFRDFFDPEILDSLADIPGMEDKVERIQNFRDALAGIAHIVEIARKGLITLGNSLSPLKKVFDSLINGAISIGGAFGRLMEKIDGVVKIGDGFKNFIDGLATSLSGFIDKGVSGISSFFDAIANTFNIDEKLEKVTQTFERLPKGIKSVKELIDPFKSLDTATGGFAGKARSAADALRSGLGKKDLIDRLHSLDTATSDAGESIDGMSKFVNGAVEKFGEFSDAIGKIKEKVSEFVEKHATSFKDSFKGIESIFSILGKALSFVINLLPNVIGLFGKAFGWIVDATGAIGRFFTNINKGIASTSKFTGVLDFLKSALDKIGEILSPITTKIGEMFGMLASGNFEGFKNIMQGLQAGGSFLIFNKLSGGLQSLFKTGEDTLKGKGLVNSIKDVFNSLSEGIGKLLGKGGEEEGKAKQILNMGIAIGILAGSILLLSTIDSDKLTNGLFGMTIVLAELLGFMTGLKAIGGGKNSIGTLSTALIKIAGAILIFAASVKILSTIKMEDMTTALLGFGGVLALIAGFFEALKLIGGKKGIKGVKDIANAMKGIGVAMVILAASMKIFATMSWDELERGLVAIGVLFVELAAFFGVMGIIEKSIGKMGLVVIASVIPTIASSLVILAAAVGIFSLMSWEGLAKAGVAIAGFFLIFAGFSALMGAIGPALLLGASALLVVSPAMIALAAAMMIFSLIPKPGKAILSLAGALAALAIGLTLMIAALPGAFALDVAAKALLKLTAPIAIIMGLGPGKFALALLAMAGALAVIGVIGLLLIPASVGLLAMSGALLVFSAAAAVAGIAIGLIATGLGLLAVSGSAGITAFMAALLTLVKGVGELFEAARDVIVKAITAIVDAIILSIPKILEGIGMVIFSILNFISANIGPIIQKVVDIIIIILATIAERIPDIIQAGILLMVAFINGMANGIRDNADIIMGAIRNLIGAIIEFVITALQWLLREIPGIGDKLASKLDGVKNKVHEHFSGEDGAEIGREYTEGIASGVDSGTKDAEGSASSLSDTITSMLSNKSGEFTDTGTGLSMDFLEGFDIGGLGAANTASGVADAMVDALEDKESDMRSAGGYLVSGLAKGIRDRKWDADNAANEVASSVVRKTKSTLEVQSPSKVGMEIGKFWDMGQALGMRNNIKIVEDAADEVANKPISSLRDALSRFSDMVTVDIDANPGIRPVLDLTDIESKSGLIDSMFNNQNRIVSMINPSGVAITPGFRSGGPSTANNFGGFTIHVNANTSDPRTLAQEIMEEIQIEIERKEAALA